MGFDTDIATAMGIVSDALGSDATVSRSGAAAVSVKVRMDYNVETMGDFGQVAGTVTMATFVKADWAPAKGDQITIGGRSLIVERIASDDGVEVKAVLNG